jgi:phage N-6-adenine-methyltransferase
MTSIGFKAKNHPQQVAARGAIDDVDDRRTTDETFEECRRLAGVEEFDLDTAASIESSRGYGYYDIESDGLKSAWFGNVWCNPPYSDLASWVTKAERSMSECDTIAMLLPANRTEQAWWQDSIETQRRNNGLDVYFLARRRRFDRPGWTKPAKGDRPPFGLCLVVWTTV